MIAKRIAWLAAAALLLGLGLPAPDAAAQTGVEEYTGATAQGLALRRLGTTKRVLMIGAHPDDEDTQLLTALALGQGADVAYLSLTRGEGGQNGIGPELGEALGLIRSEELLAARRVEGATQFFTRAYDFGYSKNAEEALRHWPRDSLLADVVGVVRLFRPDVVIAVFSGTPRDGHGQHQVSALLAREAFAAAGDPTRFPEQVAAGLPARAPAKLYQTLRSNADDATLRVAVGELDPLVGRSHFQLAMHGRSRHRSQDMGRPEPAGPRWAYLKRWEAPASAPPAATEQSLFAGLDTTLAGHAAPVAPELARVLAEYDPLVEQIRAQWNPLEPGRTVPELNRALTLLRQVERRAVGNPAVQRRIADEVADAEAALWRMAGLVFTATAEDDRLVPGETVEVTLGVWNGGTRPVAVRSLAPAIPAGWEATPLDSLPARPLAPGTLLTRRFRVRVPPAAEPTEPYFLRRARVGDLYAWPADWSTAARPFESPPLRAAATVDVAGAEAAITRPVVHPVVDLRQGEMERPVLIVPAISVLVEPQTTVLPLADRGAPAPLSLRLQLRAEADSGIGGTLHVRAPRGWRADPAALPLRFAGPEQRTVDVTLHPPAGTAPGEYTVSAEFLAEDGRTFQRGYELIDYPHIAVRTLYSPAATTVRAFDVRVPRNLRVGYIEGAGEVGAAVLAPLGIRPTLLDAAALASGDLDRFDVIVVGSRAYEVRTDLAAHNARLLDYARRGGTLIVQYNKYEFVQGEFAPFPLSMARPHDRVTDEAAPVRLLDPVHPVLAGPNRITERDFDGWVQDRGLYFAHEWDARYSPLLEMNDPGDPPLRGGLLVAPLGKGTYVYTGLAFFRQLPAGVPGAYRLFANLLALGAKDST